jgi:arylsulfatase A
MVNSRYFLVLLSAVFSLVLNSSAASRPNVILIMLDDWGYECVSANGSDSYKTPNIDRLAATGMRFEKCHVQPLCTPTRVQLMTGQYNVRNYREFGMMEPDSRTFGNLFKDAGYTTAIVGKWQLGTDPGLPKRWGFDEHCLWQFTRRPERYKNAGLEINGKEHDYTNGKYGPDIVNDYALDYIARNKDNPFLLYYPMILTHEPFVPTPDSLDYKDWANDRKAKDAKYFAGMVAYADKLIGTIAKKLDDLKIRENTLILVIGDNGTHSTVTSQFRGKPYQGGKGERTGSGTHVPFVANWPKTIPSGRVNKDIVDSTDFLPTICDAAGIKVPKKLNTDGKSFLSQLRGDTGSPRDWSYCWYAPRGGELKFEFAHDGKYKLYRNGPFVEVISDHEERPFTANLSGEAQSAREKLSRVLDQYANVRPAHLNRNPTTTEPAKPQKENKKRKR